MLLGGGHRQDGNGACQIELREFAGTEVGPESDWVCHGDIIGSIYNLQQH
jgi:hypothetical protein